MPKSWRARKAAGEEGDNRSDAIFYAERIDPKLDKDWNNLANQALTLAEAGNLLLMPGRSREQENWTKFTGMMIEAGTAAYKAANKHDMESVLAVCERSLISFLRRVPPGIPAQLPKGPPAGKPPL